MYLYASGILKKFRHTEHNSISCLGELGYLNCDDICMCVVNKLFELLEFVFDSVYVDLQYDEISLIFTAGSVSLCCLCGHVVFFDLSVRLS